MKATIGEAALAFNIKFQGGRQSTKGKPQQNEGKQSLSQ